MQISCGTISYTIINGEPRYVLVREPRTNYYGFPKGHIEAGESEIETAIRETWEEASINVDIVEGFRWENKFRLKSGGLKKVIYFLASYEGQSPSRNPEFERLDVMSLPFEKAYALLEYAETKKMLFEANEYVKACASV